MSKRDMCSTDAVLESLALYPMNAVELCHETGYARRTVQAAIKALKDGSVKQIRIASFEDSSVGHMTYPAPVYELGSEPDAKPRKRTPNSVRCRRWREKQARRPKRDFALGAVWRDVAHA